MSKSDQEFEDFFDFDFDSDARLRRAEQVAERLCNGDAIRTIASEVYGDEYEDPNTKSRALMKVKRDIIYASRHGILKLNPPFTLEKLGETFKEHFRVDCKFFNDEFPQATQGERPRIPYVVYTGAARVIAERIRDLLKSKNGKVVVANAGGHTLSKTIEHLWANVAPIREEFANYQHRPKFISLNMAATAASYDYSANYLAVRMAQIYGGEHIAVQHAWASGETQEDVIDEYNKALEQIDLLLTGAGTSAGFKWARSSRIPLKDVKAAEKKLKTAVGDVTLIPIDHDGEEVKLSAFHRAQIEDKLRPQPSFDRLRLLAEQGKVIAVICVAEYGDETSNVSTREADKARVTLAILRNTLASTVVMGRSIARRLWHLYQEAGEV